MATGTDFVNDLNRSRSPRAAEAADQQQAGAGDVSELADGYLDAAIEGLAGLRAALGVLSPEGGNDDDVSADVEEAFDAAAECLAVLRDEVDDLLMAHDLPPTSADLPGADDDE